MQYIRQKIPMVEIPILKIKKKVRKYVIQEKIKF